MSQAGNLVFQATTGTGTGSLSLIDLSAETTPQYFRNFAIVFGTGSANKFYYAIRHQAASEFEVGIGYIDTGTGVLVRDSIIESSNANAAVDFSAGRKDVIADIPASLQNWLATKPASGVSVTAGNTLMSTTAQAAFTEIDNLLKFGTFYQPLGWTIMTEDFTRGNVIADYFLTQQASGTSAASTVVGNNFSTRMLGYLNLTTGTTAAGAAAGVTGVFMDAQRFVAGDKIYVCAQGIWCTAAPTVSEDFALIAAWINQNGGATYLDTTTTDFHCYFKAQRTETNWKFYYVDNSNVLQNIDTGLAFTFDGYPTFEVLMTIGATAAQTTLNWRATSKAGVVTTGTVTGVRAFNGNSIRTTVGRILKSAGITARIMAVDAMTFAYKTAARYV